jgi:cysteine desulfurase
MAANNETGVLQPIDDIAKVCAECGVLLHSDMVQSFGKTETPLDAAGLVAASFAAHKFHGPKGAGLLYLRAGIPIESVQFGGAHENQRRPGTENVAAIAGMGAAADWVLRDRVAEQTRQAALRDRLWIKINEGCPDAIQNGDLANRLANTLNVSFPGISSETMLMALDLEGVCASSGSACMVGSVVASHVLLAMGMPVELASSAVRFSLGHETTEQEIDRAGNITGKVIQRISSAGARSKEQLQGAAI